MERWGDLPVSEEWSPSIVLARKVILTRVPSNSRSMAVSGEDSKLGADGTACEPAFE